MPVSEGSIARLQRNLADIRKSAGWTAERLGDEIGVSRQTIGNLEKGRSPLNKTQYIAIRAVLNQEAARTGNAELVDMLAERVDGPAEDGVDGDTASMRDQATITKVLTDPSTLRLVSAIIMLGPMAVSVIGALAASAGLASLVKTAGAYKITGGK